MCAGLRSLRRAACFKRRLMVGRTSRARRHNVFHNVVNVPYNIGCSCRIVSEVTSYSCISVEVCLGIGSNVRNFEEKNLEVVGERRYLTFRPFCLEKARTIRGRAFTSPHIRCSKEMADDCLSVVYLTEFLYQRYLQVEMCSLHSSLVTSNARLLYPSLTGLPLLCQ